MLNTGHLVLSDIRFGSGTEWHFRSDKTAVWHLLRVASGLGYRQSNKSYVELGPDDVLLAFPSASCSFLASKLTEMHLQVFSIDLGLLSGVFSMDESRALTQFSSQHGGDVLFFPRNHAFAARFVDICQNTPKNGLASRLRVLQLFTELVGDGLKLETLSVPVHQDGRARFRELMRELPEGELMRCSVGELSKRLCFSERHFSRLFRQELGVSLREKQQRLRLERARHLLETTPEKIINIALDVGYQSLSLFNVMFKKRYKMTPTEWRARGREAKRKPSSPRAGVGMVLLAAVSALRMLWDTAWAADPSAQSPVVSGGGEVKASGPATSTAAPGAAITNGTARVRTNAAPAQIPVKGYSVQGNTLLSAESLQSILRPYQGTNAFLSQALVDKARSELLLAYKERGWAGIGVGLDPQWVALWKTSGIVSLRVIEGKLSEIVVLNNHHFSSNNVRRSVPSLRTNIVLNSRVLEAEIAAANANRDRQIYPEIAPGSEPGASTLLLKVKDRLPLHGRFEANNYKTPGTPDIRLNSNLQYNNLWQREHSISVQYGFTPQAFKENRQDRRIPFYDRPEIGYYNASYRMPLGAPTSLERQIAEKPLEFGYNPATRQFNLPPIASVPELTFFANRSTTDTGVVSTDPTLVTATAITTIESRDVSRDLSITESMGFRLSLPLASASTKLGLSLGFDYKNYDSSSFRTNVFDQTSVIPGATPSDPPQIVKGSTGSGQQGGNGLTYFPFVLRMEGAVPGKSGTTSGSLGLTYNVLHGGAFSKSQDFERSAGSKHASANFLTLNASLAHEHVFKDDWRLIARADGQWAPQPLFSNEQFALGGMGAVRGYVQGDEFGDHGWKLTLEPRTPAYRLGLVDGTLPMFARMSVFTDYGRTYLIDPQGRNTQTALWGVGSGLNVTMGQSLDLSAVAAWSLTDTHYSRVGKMRFYLSMSFQF
ncbi:MAG: helix-turn-helix domain-containing protein [Verrucomicrobia bacterium]|nr:helix-turn-helix domain-containing protein [Verrucomicrobiota bacterium]